MTKEIKTYKPKTIQEAIEDLLVFLECDLYSKFRPEHKIKGEPYCRTDQFSNEEEMVDYLREHFAILQKQIKEITLEESKMNKETEKFLKEKKHLDEEYPECFLWERDVREFLEKREKEIKHLLVDLKGNGKIFWKNEAIRLNKQFDNFCKELKKEYANQCWLDGEEAYDMAIETIDKLKNKYKEQK